MPELPEVQTIVSDLNQKIKGDIITGFWSDWPKAIKGKTVEEFTEEMRKRKILGIRRIGKNIFIDLSGKKTLYIHLKMTGHLLVKARANSKFQIPNSKSTFNDQISKSKKQDYFGDKVNQYIHHIWYLKRDLDKSKKNTFVDSHTFADSHRTLEFSDVRKFAKIVLDDTQKISELPEIKKLGPDAMSPSLTLKKFQEILKKKKNKAIGLVLMDQETISGIGNIYRSEILFEAGLRPVKMVKELNRKEWQKLYVSTRKVLKKAVRMRGTSQSDYRDTAGAPGSFQKALKVYKKNGEKCPDCGIIIQRRKLGQRSLFFCPKCQR